MVGKTNALSFLDIELRPGKPRSIGLTIVRDRMRPIEMQRAFLDTYAPFVDFAKFSNISAALYSEDLLDSKLALYQAYQVTPIFGGMVFENAFARGKIDAFADYVIQKGAAVEISDGIISIPMDARLAVISKLREAGVEVLAEVGRKYPKAPLIVDDMVSEIETLIEHGVGLIILERGEIDCLLGDDGTADTAGRLGELFKRVGCDRIVAEVETKKHIICLIRTFGADVNLGPNIDWELVSWLEPARYGIGREIGHQTIVYEAKTGRSHHVEK